jgi:hypothetical protein
MAGIRVLTPLGLDWRYSLDGIIWQSSPVFLLDAAGNALVPGKVYTVYFRNARLNRTLIERIKLGTTGQSSSDVLDDITLRSDLEAEAVDPDSVVMTMKSSLGRIFRRFTPENFRLWLNIDFSRLTGFVTPNPISTTGYVRSTEPASLDNPTVIAAWFQNGTSWALEKVTMARLRLQLNIPDQYVPSWIIPSQAQLDALIPRISPDVLATFADRLALIRRGGLSVPLSSNDALFVAWQIAPFLGFDPLVARPADYKDLLDESTAGSIAWQLSRPWGFYFSLLGIARRIVLEQAEVQIVADQLAPLFGFEEFKPLSIGEEIDGLSDEALEKIRVKLNTSAPSFMDQFRATTTTERLEIRDIVPCCGGESTTPAMNIVVRGHYEPVGTTPANRAPVVNNAMPDKHLLSTDSRIFYLPADQFTDPDGDQLTLTAQRTTGAPLPTELIFTGAQRKFEVTDGYEMPTAIKIIATDPGGLSVSQSFLLTFEGATANQPPVLIDPMPNVTINTADEQSFALPDTQFKDPDGSAFTTTVTLADGSALPIWLSYNPSTRTFKKAQGFTTGQIDVLVTATDPGGLTATDTFTVTVNAPTTPPAAQIAEVRKKVITGTSTRWLLYVKTNPVTSTQTGGKLYVRFRTANGGFYDSGFTAWESAQNNQGSQGEYYSESEANQGFHYLVQKNTFSGEDTDASHVVYVQLSTSADGTNYQEYTFTVTENQAQSIVIIYPLV